MPPPEKQTCETCFMGHGQSCVVEEAFNRVKDHQRDSKNLRLSRAKRWMMPLDAKVLSERFERPELEPNDEHVPAGCSRRLEATAFDSQAAPPSVPDAELRAITDRATWKNPSPIGAHAIVGAFQLLLACEGNNDWTMAEKAWKSIFVRPGTLLVGVRDKVARLVVASNQFGVLCKPCSLEKKGGKKFVKIRSGAQEGRVHWHHVWDFDRYRASKIAPVGMATCRFVYGLKDIHSGFHLVCDGDYSILELAAWNAFVGVTDVWLTKLLNYQGLLCDDGGVLGKVAKLVRNILPKLSDKEFVDVMEQRGKPKTKDAGSLLSADTVNVIADALDPSDAKECRDHLEDEVKDSAVLKAVQSYLKIKGFAKATGSKSLDLEPASSRASSGRTSCAAAAGTGNKKPASLDLTIARRYLPQVAGCLINPHPDGRRFQTFYPTDFPPGSRSYTAAPPGSEGLTERDCLLGGLRWAWHRHEEKHPSDKCPYPWVKALEWADEA